MGDSPDSASSSGASSPASLPSPSSSLAGSGSAGAVPSASFSAPTPFITSAMAPAFSPLARRMSGISRMTDGPASSSSLSAARSLAFRPSVPSQEIVCTSSMVDIVRVALRCSCCGGGAR